jgi:hypothetical protein
MDDAGLGSLSRVDAREVWKNEATDFTPWLAAHIDLLGAAMGVDLEVEATEVDVGDFRIDIVARDTSTGHGVIVENQLAPTDHTHLGQLLTYAAGQKAAAMVWIAPRFRDEHRQVLDWLNDNTTEDINFFGVEIELLRVNDSPPAPHFKLVAEPNEWAKATKKPAGEPSERGIADQRLFSAILEQFKQKRPYATSASRVGPQSWFGFSGGRSGFQLNWSIFGGDRLRVELYIDVGDREENKAYFDHLLGRRSAIESAIGIDLVWERLDNRRASRIAAELPRAIDRTNSDEDSEAIAWAVDSMVAFYDSLHPVLKALPAIAVPPLE